MAAEGLPVRVAGRTLAVSESGYYATLVAAPSERSVRHAWLTDVIRRVHVDSRGTYASRRVHAELTRGHGLAVGWSIDASQTAALVTNALGMAIDSRRPAIGATPMHSKGCSGSTHLVGVHPSITRFWVGAIGGLDR